MNETHAAALAEAIEERDAATGRPIPTGEGHRGLLSRVLTKALRFYTSIAAAVP